MIDPTRDPDLCQPSTVSMPRDGWPVGTMLRWIGPDREGLVTNPLVRIASVRRSLVGELRYGVDQFISSEMSWRRHESDSWGMDMVENPPLWELVQ